MLKRSNKVKRGCAILATFGFLCALPLATVRAAASGDSVQTLARDTAMQIQLAYHRHPAEQEQRQQQLAAVVAAWRAAPRNSANDEQLTVWLRTTIRASMPGSQDALPPTPTFAPKQDRETHVAQPTPAESPTFNPAPTETQVTEPTPAIEVSHKTGEESAVDPFRDDPTDEQE